jgi:hypothetical protein
MAGMLESIGVIIALGFLMYKRKSLPLKIRMLFYSFVLAGVLIIFMTTKYSQFVYNTFSLLAGIQHPWRMFSALIFIPPTIIVILISQIKKYQLLVIAGLMIGVAVLRFPQLYTKNNEQLPESAYNFTVTNLASNNLNTIWTGETQDYPVKKTKGEIINGKGSITSMQVENSKRQYQVKATTPIRMADYTFYFPGWKVFVDGVEVPIQFQDQNYRGVITYQVPSGVHTINVKFTDTKVRLLGKLITLGCLVLVISFLISLQILARNKKLAKKLAFIYL